MATVSISDADLAFEMQLNEAMAASMGISSITGTSSGGDLTFDSPGSSAMAEAAAAIEKDALAALYLQRQELEAQQRAAVDRTVVSEVLNRFTDEAAQLLHDSAVAREIDVMSEEEWEENGDLFERAFTRGQGRSTFRVFFKGFCVSEGGQNVGAAVGGAVMDLGGVNQLVQVKKFIALPVGKNAAQYHALIELLNAAVSVGARKIIIYTDSKAVHNQIRGYWRVGTNAVRSLYLKAVGLLNGFESYDVNLALHGENWPAENLARQASFAQRQSGPSSSTVVLHCIICMEDIAAEAVYTLRKCGHKFCSSCVKQHAEATVTSGYIFPVGCPLPECDKKFTEDECKALLSTKALEVFMKKVEEGRIPEAQRFYCPYPNCSELMDKREFFDRSPRKRCRACDREFCVECHVPWHVFMLCLDYQRLPVELKNAEDAKLYRLAENQKWRQCKQCRRMIELAEGCYHMTCRCGYEFCYTCGAPYRNKLQTCLCKLWDERNIIREESDEEYDPEDDDPRPNHNIYYKTQLCRFFENGHCRLGGDCNFAHGVRELRAI